MGSTFDSVWPPILIVGESSYGPNVRLKKYVPDWITGSVVDKFFTTLYTACIASKTPVFGGLTKIDFWNRIAFCNFVPGTIGAESSSRPSVSGLKSGIRPLRTVLNALHPQGVFLIGLTHSAYSRPVVNAFGIPYVVVPHPRSGVPALFITQSFDVLIKIAS